MRMMTLMLGLGLLAISARDARAEADCPEFAFTSSYTVLVGDEQDAVDDIWEDYFDFAMEVYDFMDFLIDCPGGDWWVPGGGPWAGGFITTFVDNGDGTVTVTATGFVRVCYFCPDIMAQAGGGSLVPVPDAYADTGVES